MKTSINGMAERLREQLAAPGLIELAGCHDVLSAMILEEVGFEVIFLSGYGIAASFLGNPDIGLTGLAETALLAKNVASRLSVPMVVDADNGYGNEDNVVRTVYELEFSGAAGMVMEDQILPKRCGHTSEKRVLPLPLYMRKLEAALAARKTPMCIVARTDSGDLHDAIDRARTFHSAGADVILIDGIRSLEDAKRIGGEVPGLKQINLIYGGKTPLLAAKQYQALGFKIVQYSTPTLYVAAEAMWRQLAELHKKHDLTAIAKASMSFSDFQAFIQGKYADKARNGQGPSDSADLVFDDPSYSNAKPG